jgi:hypothetical protein
VGVDLSGPGAAHLEGTMTQAYPATASGRDPEPSALVAFLPEGAVELSVNDVEHRLHGAGLKVTPPEVTSEDRLVQTRWEVSTTVTLGEGDDALDVPIEIASLLSQEVAGFQLEHARLSDEEQAEVSSSRYSVAVSTSLDVVDPLQAFHVLVKLAWALAPDMVLLYDVDACAAHHTAWTKETAESGALPSPQALFTIHAVQDDQSERVWMHTHGLRRCGIIELEIHDAPEDGVALLSTMLCTAAAMWLERGVPEPADVFWVGEGMPLVWLPWEAALEERKPKAGGGHDDRDPAHAGASAVLYVPGKKVLGLFGSPFKNPEVLLPILNDEPLLFISSAETERMRVLSQERLDDLRALYARWADQEGWAFLVKLGYEVDDEDEAGVGTEHLWFEVHGFDGDRVDATLINQPYGIARLQQGDRGWHPLSLMSDWAAMSPLGRFGPDRVGLLQHLVVLLEAAEDVSNGAVS